MKKIYTLCVKREFESAHLIPGHEGKCQRLHGHNYRVEAYVRASELDAIGRVLEKKDLELALEAVVDILDHEYLNEISPFDFTAPTCENIAAYIYQMLAQSINNERVRLHKIKVWETPDFWVSYKEKEETES